MRVSAWESERTLKVYFNVFRFDFMKAPCLSVCFYFSKPLSTAQVSNNHNSRNARSISSPSALERFLVPTMLLFHGEQLSLRKLLEKGDSLFSKLLENTPCCILLMCFDKGPFIDYARVPRRGVGKISTYRKIFLEILPNFSTIINFWWKGNIDNSSSIIKEQI